MSHPSDGDWPRQILWAVLVVIAGIVVAGNARAMTTGETVIAFLLWALLTMMP